MEPIEVPKKKYKSRRGINAAIIANLRIQAIERPTWGEVAQTLKVDIQVVYDQINRLRKQGHIPPLGSDLVGKGLANPPRKPRRGRTEPNPSPETQIEDRGLARELSTLEESEDIPAPERRKRLKKIVDWGSDALQIKAIEVLNRMDEAADRGIGPVPPMTETSRVRRLADLMLAVGELETNMAKELAFPPAPSSNLEHPVGDSTH